MLAERTNVKLNEKISQMAAMYRGTPFGEHLRRAYRSNISDQGLCEMCNLDPEDYDVEMEG